MRERIKQVMLELNREYTYKEIIKELGWEEKGGNSKKAQIKEIESSYEFYHPMNNKTHKEKKSYIFTEQLKTPVEPSKSNCGGAHNIKNIKPMIDYLQSCLTDDVVNGEYYSMTVWLCDVLKLLNKDLCNVVYQNKKEFINYCNNHGVHNYRLVEDYVLTAKFILKNILLKVLEHMKKKNICEYHNGYIFVYKLVNCKLCSYGTHTINDYIVDNEIEICNDLNEKYHLSNSKKNRQLLLQIYANKELTKKFNETKILKFNENYEIVKQLNEEIECKCDTNHIKLDEKHHLINYYSGISIVNMQFVEVNKVDVETLRREITINIRNKTQKALYSKYYINQQSNKRNYYYTIFKDSIEMYEIEKLLFVSNIPSINIAFGSDCDNCCSEKEKNNM